MPFADRGCQSPAPPRPGNLSPPPGLGEVHVTDAPLGDCLSELPDGLVNHEDDLSDPLVGAHHLDAVGVVAGENPEPLDTAGPVGRTPDVNLNDGAGAFSPKPTHDGSVGDFELQPRIGKTPDEAIAVQTLLP